MSTTNEAIEEKTADSVQSLVAKSEPNKNQFPDTVQESIRINETAAHRMIGLTVETRPEYVTDENCQLWRELGSGSILEAVLHIQK